MVAAVTKLIKELAHTVGGVVGIGGGGSSPAPVAAAAMPVNVAAGTSASDAALLAMNKARGRASTLAAGEDTMLEDQMQRGMLKTKQRQGAASRTLLG